MFTKHFAGDDLACVPHQQFQQTELDRGEIDITTGPRDPACGEIESQIVDDQDRYGSDTGPPNHGIQPGQELGKIKRLRDVIVGTRVQAVNPVLNRTHGGQQNDRGHDSCGPNVA